MILLPGFLAGIVLVVLVIGLCVVTQRVIAPREKPIRHGDGRYSIGPVPDFYGRPHGDHFGRVSRWSGW